MPAHHGCTRSKRNDGLFCCQQPPPSTFGLSAEEIWRHAEDLFRAGWTNEEIRAVLALPAVDA
jgi:hypothetical protein